jgi:hypothetical protein
MSVLKEDDGNDHIEGNCGCDDPGLAGAMIGAPVGAVVGGILGARFF